MLLAHQPPYLCRCFEEALAADSNNLEALGWLAQHHETRGVMPCLLPLAPSTAFVTRLKALTEQSTAAVASAG